MNVFKRLLNYFHGPILKSKVGELDRFGQFTESRFKIQYNPFSNEFYWCQLNVETHIFEWLFVASHRDIYQWFKESEETQKYGFAVTDLLSQMSNYDGVEEYGRGTTKQKRDPLKRFDID